MQAKKTIRPPARSPEKTSPARTAAVAKKSAGPAKAAVKKTPAKKTPTPVKEAPPKRTNARPDRESLLERKLTERRKRPAPVKEKRPSPTGKKPLPGGRTTVRFSVEALRPQDMLWLRFEFVNMQILTSRGRKPVVARLAKNKPAYIIAHFPCQNIFERAFHQGNAEKQKLLNDENYSQDSVIAAPYDSGIKPPPVETHVSGESRLVFKVPATQGPIPFSIEAILDKLGAFQMNLAANAKPPQTVQNGASILEVQTPILRGSIQLVKDVIAKKAAAATTSVAGRKKLSVLLLNTLRDERIAARSAASKDSMVRAAGYSAGVSAGDQGTLAPAGDIALEVIRPKPQKPSDLQTALEAPFRVIISPNKFGGWIHSNQPFTSAETQYTELWHTWLGTRPSGKESDPIEDKPNGVRTVRAIWSPDAQPEYNELPPVASGEHAYRDKGSLNDRHRHNIVHLSSNFDIPKKVSSGSLVLPGFNRYYTPRAIDVDRLMLSSLGAWLDLNASWNVLDVDILSVEQWVHKATLGRDQYVKIVEAGYLYPFGHRASLVTITERQINPNFIGNRAFLRQIKFIIVRVPLVDIGTNPAHKVGAARMDLWMPFKSVRIRNKQTPLLDLPIQPPSANSDYIIGTNAPHGQNLLWPRVDGADFKFDLQVMDLAGNMSDIAMPLQFVGKEFLDGASASDWTALRNAYNKENSTTAESRRTPDFAGQKVALAQTRALANASEKSEEPVYSMKSVEFRLARPDGTAPSLTLLPILHGAQPQIDAMAHMSADGNPYVKVKYFDRYLANEFANNPNEVFAEVVHDTVKKGLDFSGNGDRSGGLVQPNMAINGLSRLAGAVGGELNDAADGTFDPMKVFEGFDAKLFGIVSLSDILGLVGSAVGVGDTKMPKIVSTAISGGEGFLRALDRIAQLGIDTSTVQQKFAALDSAIQSTKDQFAQSVEMIHQQVDNYVDNLSAQAANMAASALQDALDAAQEFLGYAGNVSLVTALLEQALSARELVLSYEWTPKMKNFGDVIVFDNVDTAMRLYAEMRMRAAVNPKPSVRTQCSISKFDINLLGSAKFIVIKMNKVSFTAGTNQSAQVDVDLNEIQLVGVLEFVQKLQDLVPAGLLGDAPEFDVSSSGITLGMNFALPNIAVGVFSLQNMSLGFGVEIPFDSNPLAIKFNFCTRENPFLLTVCLFGGGGFFGITLTPNGVHILEAAFEFGANLSVDFGVASGGVSVMAGVYFRLEDDDATLIGYFNLHGHVRVLAIISASLEFNLSLEYQTATGKCVGRAELIIEITLLIFSASVTITCERKFAGSNGDPTFAEIMTPYLDSTLNTTVDPWEEYCSAFGG